MSELYVYSLIGVALGVVIGAAVTLFMSWLLEIGVFAKDSD